MAKKQNDKPAARQFRVVGVEPGPVHKAHRIWDLRNLSPAEQAELYDLGCSYLEEITVTADGNE